MVGDISVASDVYIVTGMTNMRKSIDGLCAIVKNELHMDPRRSAIYLFCGSRCDRIKILLCRNRLSTTAKTEAAAVHKMQKNVDLTGFFACLIV